MNDANNQSSATTTPSGGEKVVKASSLVNGLQVQSWKVLEDLIGRQYDLASVAEISGALGMAEHVTRRILITWEFVGLAERRGDLWRLTSYLTTEIPNRLKLALAQKFKELENAGDDPPAPPHIRPRAKGRSGKDGVGADGRKEEIS